MPLQTGGHAASLQRRIPPVSLRGGSLFQSLTHRRPWSIRRREQHPPPLAIRHGREQPEPKDTMWAQRTPAISPSSLFDGEAQQCLHHLSRHLQPFLKKNPSFFSSLPFQMTPWMGPRSMALRGSAPPSPLDAPPPSHSTTFPCKKWRAWSHFEGTLGYLTRQSEREWHRGGRRCSPQSYACYLRGWSSAALRSPRPFLKRCARPRSQQVTIASSPESSISSPLVYPAVRMMDEEDRKRSVVRLYAIIIVTTLTFSRAFPAAFCGHDHHNDYVCAKNGLHMCYGRVS